MKRLTALKASVLLILINSIGNCISYPQALQYGDSRDVETAVGFIVFFRSDIFDYEGLTKFEEVLKDGFVAKQKTKDGNTLLTLFMKLKEVGPDTLSHSQEKIVNLLLRYGVDINRPNDDGLTPVLIAAARNDDYFLRLLIDRGADGTVKDKNNKTIFDHYGRTIMSSTIREFLKEHGVEEEITAMQRLQAQENYIKRHKITTNNHPMLALINFITFDDSPEARTFKEEYMKITELDDALKTINASILNLKNNPSLLSDEQLKIIQRDIDSFEKEQWAKSKLGIGSMLTRTKKEVFTAIAQHMVSIKAKRDDILPLLEYLPKDAFEYRSIPLPGKPKKHGVVWLNKPSKGKELQLTSLEHLKKEFKKQSGTEAELKFK